MKNDYVQTLRQSIGNTLIHIPGVRALIFNDREEILLQLRRDMECWGLPAGAVELDETLLEALYREVKEETSLLILEAEPMALYSGPNQRFQYPNGDWVQGFSIAFIIHRWQGRPQADGEEGTALEFFSLAQLPDNFVPIHLQTINDYKKYNGKLLLL